MPPSIMPPRILCLGHAAHDLVYRVHEIPAEPRKILATAFRECGGGMAANAAVAAARLGARVTFWGRVAADRLGDRIVADLEREGVDVGRIRRLEGRASPSSAILIDARGERLVCSFSDPAFDRDPAWLPLDEIESFDAILVDTRWREGSERVLREAHARNVPTVLDADVAPSDTLAALVPAARFSIFSEAGLRASWPGSESAEDALAAWADRCPGSVVGATQGPDGLLYRAGASLHRIRAPRVAVVDTLAAGDVWHAAFTVALAEHRELEPAARFANAAASLKCTRDGGRLASPTRAEVDAFLEPDSA